MKFNIKRIVIVVVLLLLLVAGGAYYFLVYSRQPGLPSQLSTQPIGRGTIITKIGATGRVEPNQIVTLSWQTNGTVGKVNVKEKDQVKSGDVLLELDPESLDGSILQAMQKLPAAERALELLNVSDVKRTQAKENLSQAEISYDNAKKARELKNQRNTSDTNLEVAQASYLQAKSNLESAKTFYSYVQDRPEDDLTRAQAAMALSSAQKSYDWALWNYQWAQNKPLPEDVRLADADLKVAESKLADARREWEKVKDNPDPDDITSAKATVDSLKTQIDKTKIVAPINGTVSDLNQLTGDLVKPGQPVLKLIDYSHMYLKISISEVDINKVQVGKRVSFVFDAIGDKTYEGFVTDISTVGKLDQEIMYYTVTCELKNFDTAIKPGMTAAASIEEKRAENVLVIPNKAIFKTGSSRSVYVVRNNSIQTIPVELGLVSEEFSELKSGDIKEGDMVVTNPNLIPTPGSGK